MGRVAGIPRSVQSGKAWREQIAKEKYLASVSPPNPPLATMHTGKRQILLLWLMNKFYEDGMLVNWLRCPKYTKDMESLVRKNALHIKRECIIGTRMGTVLYLTNLGKKILQSSNLKQSEKDWIIQSFNSNSLR